MKHQHNTSGKRTSHTHWESVDHFATQGREAFDYGHYDDRSAARGSGKEIIGESFGSGDSCVDSTQFCNLLVENMAHRGHYIRMLADTEGSIRRSCREHVMFTK
ncbi:uncharacterized protein LOC135169566 [Diachasmimorpha longicaudata]|uniref:uncharacterized protein LOC135169566 n=1 Tax=Diachasmimorpha longicaudata TaxID=58733 RepID=UPI0030B88A4B